MISTHIDVWKKKYINDYAKDAVNKDMKKYEKRRSSHSNEKVEKYYSDYEDEEEDSNGRRRKN